MTARKIYTFRLNDATPDDHPGRVGEITYRDGYLYYHDGVTAGGELISGGGGGGSTSWASVTGKPSFATVATSGSYADLTGTPSIVETNQTLNTSDSVSFNRLTVTGASGIEGGEIQLAKAPTSTLAGDVIIDVYDNKLRFFEGGGNGRGFYLDLTTGANNTSTNIMSGGGSFSGSYNDLTDKPALFSGDYDDLTDKPTIPTSFSSLVNGSFTASLGTDGNLTLPAGGDILVDDGKIISADGEDFKIIVQDSDDNGNRLDLVVTDGTDQATRVEVDRDGMQINTNLLDVANQRNWRFKTDGTTEFPDDTISQYNSLKIKSGASSSTAIWTFGTDGKLTLPIGVSIDNNVDPLYPRIIADSGKTFSIQGQGNDGTAALAWTVNPDAASQYAAVSVSRAGGDNLAKVVLQAQSDSGDEGTVKTWKFDEAGTLTLSAGGTITEGGGFTGAIKLTPAGGANEYQALVIYPTAAGDGDHIHLTAGGGSTELYLGNDLHFVKLESDGNIRIQADNGVNGAAWTFGTDGKLQLPSGGDILDSTGASVLGGGGTTLPADASGYLVNDGTGALSWAAGDGTFSGDYDDLTNTPDLTVYQTASTAFSGAYADLTGKPTLFSGSYDDLSDQPSLFDGNYNSLTNKPTYKETVSTGTGPGGNNQADSLVLAGLNPTENIPSTYGGDLILKGGYGGANNDLFGEVRIKSGTIGSNFEWHFTVDKKIKLPAGGNIVDSTGATAFVSLATLKQVVADSTDFADFKSRIASMS